MKTRRPPRSGRPASSRSAFSSLQYRQLRVTNTRARVRPFRSASCNPGPATPASRKPGVPGGSCCHWLRGSRFSREPGGPSTTARAPAKARASRPPMTREGLCAAMLSPASPHGRAPAPGPGSPPRPCAARPAGRSAAPRDSPARRRPGLPPGDCRGQRPRQGRAGPASHRAPPGRPRRRRLRGIAPRPGRGRGRWRHRPGTPPCRRIARGNRAALQAAQGEGGGRLTDEPCEGRGRDSRWKAGLVPGGHGHQRSQEPPCHQGRAEDARGDAVVASRSLVPGFVHVQFSRLMEPGRLKRPLAGRDLPLRPCPRNAMSNGSGITRSGEFASPDRVIFLSPDRVTLSRSVWPPDALYPSQRTSFQSSTLPWRSSGDGSHGTARSPHLERE